MQGYLGFCQGAIQPHSPRVIFCQFSDTFKACKEIAIFVHTQFLHINETPPYLTSI